MGVLVKVDGVEHLEAAGRVAIVLRVGRQELVASVASLGRAGTLVRARRQALAGIVDKVDTQGIQERLASVVRVGSADTLV